MIILIENIHFWYGF